jgi:hypothetical protein
MVNSGCAGDLCTQFRSIFRFAGVAPPICGQKLVILRIFEPN